MSLLPQSAALAREVVEGPAACGSVQSSFHLGVHCIAD